MGENTNKTAKTPGTLLAALPLIFMVVTLVLELANGIDIKILILLCAIVTTIYTICLGHTWAEIEQEFTTKLAKAFPAIMILLVVGLMIGAWIVSGTIPYLVYIGLKIISPKYMILTSFLVTVILSVSTGTSWGAAGTVGAALMGVAAGMNAPLPAVAGAIVAGAYFGDKLSPLSDSTNMAALASDTKLYDHIGHMFYTTLPGFAVCVVVYLIAGFSSSGAASVDQIDEVLVVLGQLFNFSMPMGLVLLVPPIIVIAGSLLKKPTIPVMMLSSTVAIIIALVCNGFSFADCSTAMLTGFKLEMLTNMGIDVTALPATVANLLQRGGMSSMMNTVLMAFCGYAFISALTVSGALNVLISKVMKHLHTTGQLIAATTILGVVVITVVGEATVTFLMIGGMFKDEYIKRGLETKNLSRTLEDSVTVIDPLVPWTMAGIYMASTLGVPTLSYLPWACLCYTGVIFAIIWGFTGFGIAKIKKGGHQYDDYVRLTGKTELPE